MTLLTRNTRERPNPDLCFVYDRAVLFELSFLVLCFVSQGLLEPEPCSSLSPPHRSALWKHPEHAGEAATDVCGAVLGWYGVASVLKHYSGRFGHVWMGVLALFLSRFGIKRDQTFQRFHHKPFPENSHAVVFTGEIQSPFYLLSSLAVPNKWSSQKSGPESKGLSDHQIPSDFSKFWPLLLMDPPK